MGIYIKGVEMPRHCGKCAIEWCDRWKRLIIAGMPIAKERPSDCPLVPVPPHGRLIDADEAIGHLFIGEQCLYSWNEIEDAIDATKTIIPAEEGE